MSAFQTLLFIVLTTTDSKAQEHLNWNSKQVLNLVSLEGG